MSAKKKTLEQNPFVELDSAMSIELRRIMLRLDRAVDLAKNRVLMITSSERGEGKSTLSLHFSHTLATHTEKKILLVDADMRRPVQHRGFSMKRFPGLAEFITDPTIEPTIHSSGIANLDILPAGRTKTEISRLLSSDSLTTAFLKLRERYDLIVVDTPPVIYVSDPLQIARIADGVVMVVMAGRTNKEICRRGVDILKNASVDVMGVVANNLTEVLPYYYDHKYYGYGD
jgi:protein-tyrosine kinase